LLRDAYERNRPILKVDRRYLRGLLAEENPLRGETMPDRSRRIVVVAHCVLNANARVGGTAHCPGADLDVLGAYLSEGVGIVQLPCPETTFLGMSRFGMTRNQYDTQAFRRHCSEILLPSVDALDQFARAGYELEAAVGIEGSPSCGVCETTEGHSGGKIETVPTCSRVQGRGIMIQVLAHMLEERGLYIPLVGVSAPRCESSSTSDGGRDGRADQRDMVGA
jgi:predicted secreted protein